MTTPIGKLVTSINQSKAAAKRTFGIWLAVTVVLAALLVALMVVSNSGLSNLSALLLLVFPGAYMAVAGVIAFQPPYTVDIFDDGFVRRNTKQNNVTDEALWTDVSDVTFIQINQLSTAEMTGIIMFGIVGAIIGRAISKGSKVTDTAIWINAPQKRVKLNSSYGDLASLKAILTNVTKEVWIKEATQTIDSGGSVQFGSVKLNALGISKGNQAIDWSAITEAKYANEMGVVGISWIDPSRGNQRTMSIPLGSRGAALIQVVNQKIGKPAASMASRLGRL